MIKGNAVISPPMVKGGDGGEDNRGPPRRHLLRHHGHAQRGVRRALPARDVEARRGHHLQTHTAGAMSRLPYWYTHYGI